MGIIEKVDPQIAAAIDAEVARQAHTIELIASENHVSAPVLAALGTVLTDKYAEGSPGRRYYRGCDNIDTIERLCIDRAKALFGADHANVQPHSGTSANLAVYMAALKPGAKIMGMRLDHGGHLSHGMKINFSGMWYAVSHYGVDRQSERLEMDQVRQAVLAERPDMLIAGASAYPRTIDFAAFGRIAQEVGCLLLADVAHIAGLIVGGVHPHPMPYADFVTTTNHKTLRGPRGGIILCRKQFAKAVDQAVFPGMQGGPLPHVIAAKAIAFHEAMQPEFKWYAAAIVANAKALADALLAHGWRLVTGGTDNHMMLVDLRSRDPELTGDVASGWLAEAGIISNKNMIPFDPRTTKDTSGLRFGTPAVTTRGMRPDQMAQLAQWIDDILTSHGNQEMITKVAGAVEEFCREFPIPAQRG
ncbi:MAG TPA: serine hydroxymethyltransferase [Phycisphaerae bacterium]|nr:serine hydroxymethyltransferase [Phycisphaerae bacterium]HDZ44578.1 serine hydroxymethyltransferase [Phycisphaerae bacterium]